MEIDVSDARKITITTPTVTTQMIGEHEGLRQKWRLQDNKGDYLLLGPSPTQTIDTYCLTIEEKTIAFIKKAAFYSSLWKLEDSDGNVLEKAKAVREPLGASSLLRTFFANFVSIITDGLGYGSSRKIVSYQLTDGSSLIKNGDQWTAPSTSLDPRVAAAFFGFLALHAKLPS